MVTDTSSGFIVLLQGLRDTLLPVCEQAVHVAIIATKDKNDNKTYSQKGGENCMKKHARVLHHVRSQMNGGRAPAKEDMRAGTSQNELVRFLGLAHIRDGRTQVWCSGDPADLMWEVQINSETEVIASVGSLNVFGESLRKCIQRSGLPGW